MRRLGLVVIAACAGTPPTGTARTTPTPTPTPTPTVSAAPAVTRAEADRALRDDAPIDYERPFNNKPYLRSDTTKQFHVLCEGGDKEACIVEAELVGYDAKFAYLHTVVANCRAGHVMSCRALPINTGGHRFDDLTGAMSRLYECGNPEMPAPCNVAMLRHECEMGFPQACYNLGAHDPSPVGDALLKKFVELSAEGCRAGIAMDCRMADLSRGVDDRIEAGSRLCELHRDDCTALYYAYFAAHDLLKARDGYERACQYGGYAQTCLALAGKYVDGELAEPVLGRGQALIDWACPKLAQSKHGKTTIEYKARCAAPVAK